MTFPSSPTNGQQATVNNIVYSYDSSIDAWTKTGTITSVFVANSIIVNSTVDSVSPVTGAVQIAGGLGIGGNLYVNKSLYIANIIATAGNVHASNINVTGNLHVESIVTTQGNLIVGGFYSYVNRVLVDFGSTPCYNFTTYITDARAQVGAKVSVNPSAFTTNARAILGNDDLEFDNFMCTANVVANGNIAMYITSYPGPVKGQRNFEYSLG